VECNAAFDISQLLNHTSFVRSVNVGYTYIYQNRHDTKDIYKSNYALEYLRHKFVAGLTHSLFNKYLTANWNFRFQKRMGGYEVYDANNKATGTIHSYPSFCLMDVKVQWDKPNYQLFASVDNLFDRHYYDYGNIRQPGIWVNVGATFRMNL